jgi:hypothetical protein
MRVFVIASIASIGLAGCSSTSMPSFDLFKSKPKLVTLQLESNPPGADARTSLGPSCRTPCSVSVPSSENFTVAYALNKYKPETVPVQIASQTSGDASALDPNPVVAQLEPLVPSRKGKPAPKVAKKPPPAAAPADPEEDSPFPPPTR